LKTTEGTRMHLRGKTVCPAGKKKITLPKDGPGVP